MATTTIKVTADTRDAQRALSDLQTSLGRLASIAAVTALGQQFVKLADASTNLANKLKLVAQEGQTSDDLFKLMTKSANDLGVPVKDLGDLFFAVANNTKDLGLAQTEQLRVADLVLKSLILTGSTLTEASGALIQFGQALSQGTLRGDELNSMLERMPMIADAIAAKFGVTRGALKTLGEQGKITSRIVIDSMNEAGVSIDQAFGNRIRTVQESFNILGNTVKQLASDFDKQTGASQAVSYAILIVADAVITVYEWFQKWGSVIIDVAQALATLFIAFRIFKIIDASIIGVVSLMEKFGKMTGAVFAELSAKLAIFVSTIGLIAEPINKVFDGIKNLFDSDQLSAADRYNKKLDEINKRLGIDSVEASQKAQEATKASTKYNEELKKAREAAYQTRGEDYRKILENQNATLKSAQLYGVELEIQQAINQANSQLVKEIKDNTGKIVEYTKGLSAAEEGRLTQLILQNAQKKLEFELQRNISAATEDLYIYQNRAADASQTQLDIDLKIAAAKREHGSLLTAELQQQIRLTAEAQTRLSLTREIDQANASAVGNLTTYRSNLNRMTGDQLEIELKIAEAQRKYGDLLTDELKQKMRSTEESAKQLDYLKQMKTATEAALTPLTGAAAGANVAGQLSSLLGVDAAVAAGQTMMNGLQELRNQDLINEQQYQDAKLAAAVKTNDAIMAATRNKFEQESLLRIQAQTGTLFGYEAQKSMAKDAADFEMKSAFEKTQFGIEQAAAMFTAMGKENKKAFEASKALNIASALMNTFMAATKALATYPFPFGLIGAGLAIAAGMAQVSAIRAQTYSGRALGGPVMGNQSYMVGERGPEVFTPATSGKITRNNQIGESQPVTVNFNINAVDASGFDALLFQRRGLITSMIADAQQERGRRA